MEEEGLVQWMGDPPDTSFGFYLREAYQSQTGTKKDIILHESLGSGVL